MDFIKNFLALILSTAVWTAGLLVILSLYYIVTQRDVFYGVVLLVSLLVTGGGVMLGRHNARVQAALEIPMGILGL